MVERARQHLTWVPLVGALYVVVIAPWAPVAYIVDSIIYAEQAEAIRHLDVPSGRYPPGLPVLLAIGDLVGLEMWEVIKLISLTLVVLVVLAARRIGGPVAGAVAGLLCCASPWLIASGQFVMSDALGAVFAVLALHAVVTARPGLAVVATTLGVLARMMSGIGIIALLVTGRRQVVAAVLAAFVLLGGYQWLTNGSPFRTGYEPGQASWSVSNIMSADMIGDRAWVVDGMAAKATTPDTPERDTPNIVAYPSMVLGAIYAFMPPLVASIGLWALWVRRNTPAAQFVGLWLAASLLVLLPYYYQSPRLLAPAMMLVLVYTAVGVADLVANDRSVHASTHTAPT